MTDFETLRASNIARNKALLKELELEDAGHSITSIEPRQLAPRPPKRRKIDTKPTQLPSRSSARLASSSTKPNYSEEPEREPAPETSAPRIKPAHKTTTARTQRSESEISALRKQWSDWKAAAVPPSRDESGTFWFSDAPGFAPNKSPEEMLREGVFGGSYFRRLYSSTLGIWIEGDWEELPNSWTQGLNVDRYLVSTEYDAEVNKHGVRCGQSIEEWEGNGWIEHEWDVRGWFQWYCRFFFGRRCGDDERQISRWRRCVGETGRWRRALLRKYREAGIRSVNDEGGDEVEGVSPAIHQTCLHWAWEVKQGVLDEFWRTGGR